MAQLYDILKPENKYWDKKNYASLEAYAAALQISTTVYVGNLSFYTQQNSIKQLFQRAGNVKDIIMGIDNQGNPCGFCFVVFETRWQAQLSVQYVSKTRLGGRIIRVDWDPGYMEGRQKGRGTSGQQRRDDFRNKEDPQRPRKKPATNYQSNYSGNRDRGDSYRGDRQRVDRGGQRRDYNRPTQNRGYRQDRGDRNDRSDRGYRGDRNDRGQGRGQRREYRQNRQPKQHKEQTQPKKQKDNQQIHAEY